jgi:uncharacterized RDD family membrane protein YckC
MEGEMMYCTSCGWKNDDRARFCQRCGAALQATSQEPGLPQSVATAPVQYAGFWRRFGAALIDGIIIYIIGFIGGLIVLSVASVAADGGLDWFDSLLLAPTLGLVLSWIYYAVMESSSRQATPGKMALGIVVTDTNGNRVSFGRATGRFFSKAVLVLFFYLPYIISCIMIAFTPKKQALHDMMADCLVMVKR